MALGQLPGDGVDRATMRRTLDGCTIGRNVVLMGTGPLLYLVAYQYAKAGAKAGVKVAAVLDTARFADQLAALPGMLTQPAVLAKGLYYVGWLRAHGAAVTSGLPVVAIEGDSAFGFSGMELETICRYELPVTTIIFNNNGVYRGTDVNPTGGKDVAPTVFVKNARYDKMIEAFGGIGYHVTTPEEMTRALTEAIAAGKPALINAVIDETAGTESGRLTNLNPSTAGKK
eukprot:gene30389-37597_t